MGLTKEQINRYNATRREKYKRDSAYRENCKAKANKWSEENREKAKAISKRQYWGNRAKLEELKKTLECVDCGNSDTSILEFDHLPEYEKKRCVTELLSCKWQTILKEMEKCEPVCTHCHKARSKSRGQGPWSKKAGQ